MTAIGRALASTKNAIQQAQLARALGVSRSLICRWTKGTKTISLRRQGEVIRAIRDLDTRITKAKAAAVTVLGRTG